MNEHDTQMLLDASERDALREEIEKLRRDGLVIDSSKLSIMYGWLVYDVGEHTCGGYGPESNYAHEPGCGFEPMVHLEELPGWPGDIVKAAREHVASLRNVAVSGDWNAVSETSGALIAAVEKHPEGRI